MFWQTSKWPNLAAWFHCHQTWLPLLGFYSVVVVSISLQVSKWPHMAAWWNGVYPNVCLGLFFQQVISDSFYSTKNTFPVSWLSKSSKIWWPIWLIILLAGLIIGTKYNATLNIIKFQNYFFHVELLWNNWFKQLVYKIMIKRFVVE